MVPLQLVPIIGQLKSAELLEALLAQDGGRFALNTFERCELLKAGFSRFETPLLDELFRSFEKDDPRLLAIAEALAEAGTGKALETLDVIDYRIASRIHELRAELTSGERSAVFLNQLMRGEHLPAREEVLRQIRQAIQQIRGRPEPPPMNAPSASGTVSSAISELLLQPESHRLEFKAALRSNFKGAVEEKLEHRIMQTVAGFANATGGTLLIGVEDSPRKAIGLAKDYDSLKGDRDQFERHLRQLFHVQFGKAATVLNVKISFPQIDGLEICRVEVEPASEPLFINYVGKEEFYVRNGNANSSLEGIERYKYQTQRFGR
jgi:AcrR family transcriptional regulator